MSAELGDRSALKTIGDNIRAIRSVQGYSQENFARKVRIDLSYYSSIERGLRNVCIIKILVIARGLGVSPNEIFEGTF